VFRKWVSEEYHGKRDLPEPETSEREESKLSKEEWREYSQSLWEIEPVKNGKHPAPFPVKIPSRLIRLYSFQGDTVLDPFCGGGTTPLAAIKNDRHYCGYEISEEYSRLARERTESNE
jgi:site-specific DNA-methyltransferase (adenine-specific)